MLASAGVLSSISSIDSFIQLSRSLMSDAQTKEASACWKKQRYELSILTMRYRFSGLVMHISEVFRDFLNQSITFLPSLLLEQKYRCADRFMASACQFFFSSFPEQLTALDESVSKFSVPKHDTEYKVVTMMLRAAILASASESSSSKMMNAFDIKSYAQSSSSVGLFRLLIA